MTAVCLHHVSWTWATCPYEAQVAQSLMKNKLTMIVLDKEVTNKNNLSSGIKTWIKTRTFILWDETDKKFWRRIDDAMLSRITLL